MPFPELPSAELIHRKVHEASQQLGCDEDRLLARAGWSQRQREAYSSQARLPTLAQLSSLGDASGLPMEFFVSEYGIPIAPAKFRAGSTDVEEGNEPERGFHQRRAILRLGVLADLIAETVGSIAGRGFAGLGRRVRGQSADPAVLLLDALGISPRGTPIGPKLLDSLGNIGVQVIFAGIYHKADVIGLSWWQRGNVPTVACSTSVSLRRAYFTVAHEVMHLLFDLPAEDEPAGYRCIPVPKERTGKSIERRADEAAARLLMPDVLREVARPIAHDRGPLDAARRLSNMWDVSTQSVALRLVTWGFAKWHDIGTLFEPVEFALSRSRPARGFGSPRRTKEVIRMLYKAGVSATYISSTTGLSIDSVLQDLGRLPETHHVAEQPV